MNTYISMLRGINVSGQKMIKMEALKALYESLNFKNVKTYIQSGNVLFESMIANPAEITKKIEDKIKRSFGFSVPVVLRMPNELHRVIEKNPFLIKRKEDVTKLHVTFLSRIPDSVLVNEIKSAAFKPDEFIISGREIYVFCPGGYGNTKINNSFFEKKLNVSATTRNWKTVNMLSDMAK